MNIGRAARVSTRGFKSSYWDISGDSASMTPGVTRTSDEMSSIRDEFATAYASALTESESVSRREASGGRKRAAYPMDHPVSRAIVDHGQEVDVGAWKMSYNAKDDQGREMRTAGFWKMEIGADSSPYLVRSYERSGPVRVGDNLSVVSDMTDLYGKKVKATDRLTVVEAYEDIVEARVGNTGDVHAFSSEEVASHCRTATEETGSRREAAMVVPGKFKSMIHERTGGKAVDEYDHVLWGEYLKAGYEQNSYAQMESFLSNVFGPKPGMSLQASQKDGDRREAQDSETKDYYDELWGDTDPGYAKALTAGENARKKRDAIRKQYTLMMERAPSRNALAHYDNTIARLAQQFGETVDTIGSIVSDRRQAELDRHEDEVFFANTEAHMP